MKLWRFLGIDDSFNERKCCIFGCITSGNYVEGFMYDEIEIDGFDSTEKIVKMVLKSKFREQIKSIFLGGITFGGFNIADIQEISIKTGIPVIVILRRHPDFDEFFNAIRNLPDAEKRYEIALKAGKIYKLRDIFVQIAGINLSEAEKLINASIIKGKIPEALRIAHLAASAVIHGESKGRV